MGLVDRWSQSLAVNETKRRERARRSHFGLVRCYLNMQKEIADLKFMRTIKISPEKKRADQRAVFMRCKRSSQWLFVLYGLPS